MTILSWPKGGMLLWPAFVCGIAVSGYFFLGPTIYRKAEGKLPLSTRLVMAPLIFGQYLSWCYYRRQCNAWDEATPRVWIGRMLTNREAAEAVHRGVVAVLDLTAEFSEATHFLATTYRNIPILDLTAPTSDQIRQCVLFIQEHVRTGTVYVHCKIGYSRSAAVVGAYLLQTGLAATADEAMTHLRAIRPSIVIRPEASESLIESAKSLD